MDLFSGSKSIAIPYAQRSIQIDLEEHKTIQITVKSKDEVKSKIHDSRSLLWKKMFGDEPMPESESNVVEKYAGIIGSDLGIISDEKMSEAIEELDD